MSHVHLFIPGPTEVRADVLQAQTGPMIGHRSSDCDALVGRVETKIKQVFQTENRVHRGRFRFRLARGGYSQRRTSRLLVWRIRQRRFQPALVRSGSGLRQRGRQRLWISPGQPVRAADVAALLDAGGEWDAITVVHNETSTGVEAR